MILSFRLNFLIENLLTRVLVGDICVACDNNWLTNLVIYYLPQCVTVSSSVWCGSCRCMMVKLSLMITLVFFFFFSLSTNKIHHYPLFFFFFLRVLIIWIFHFILIPFMEGFFLQFNISITISHLYYFSFSPYFLYIYILDFYNILGLEGSFYIFLYLAQWCI